MVGALVQFPNPIPRTYEQVEADWATHGPRYETLPGFLQKSFLWKDDGATIGGFYLWESQEAAEAYYDEEWYARMTAYAGTRPSITYFQVPAVLKALHLPTIAGVNSAEAVGR